MVRTCLKCGFGNQQATGDSSESCPKCGAIYSRVEMALREPMRNTETRTTRARLGGGSNEEDLRYFVSSLREQTAYPNYRFWTFAFFIVLVAVGAFALLWAVGLLFSGQMLFGVFALLMAAFTFVFARLWQEVAAMAADFVDATLVVARSNQSSGHQRQ